MRSGFEDYIKTQCADFICLQETRCEKFSIGLDGYFEYWNTGEQSGYAGVLTLSKYKPINVIRGIDNEDFDNEARAITLEFDEYFIVNIYIPSSVNKSLARYYFRIEFDNALYTFIENLKAAKPVIICGDFNVAHKYIDINAGNLRNEENPPGFKAEEREGFEKLLSLGFIDSFRHLHPDSRTYTWFSKYKTKERRIDFGSRIDYFLVEEEFIDRVKSCTVNSHIKGSDHCPISLDITL